MSPTSQSSDPSVVTHALSDHFFTKDRRVDRLLRVWSQRSQLAFGYKVLIGRTLKITGRGEARGTIFLWRQLTGGWGRKSSTRDYCATGAGLLSSA